MPVAFARAPRCCTEYRSSSQDQTRPEIHVRKTILILGASAVLGACATQPLIWEKSGATEADYRRDAYECERDVRQSGHYGGGGYGLAGAIASAQAQENMKDFFKRCMVAHGYWLRSSGGARSSSSEGNVQGIGGKYINLN